MNPTRRKFIKDTSRFSMGLGAISLNPTLVKTMKRKVSANDKVQLGLIGARGRGFRVLEQALQQPDTECLGICDIDDSVIRDRVNEVQQLQDRRPESFKDFRKLLEHPDLDAVIIGTPDHWHCLQTVYACDAGKDVYVEKPMANSLAELDVMVNATRRYKRVVQVGQQQRSGKHWQQAIDSIRSGKIGQLRRINIWANFRYGIGGPVKKDSAVPEGVDFDMWLGPAPQRTFNEGRFHGSWRMFWDYGGGLMTDWGVHLIDMALWAGNISTTPAAVVATGGNFAYPDHAHETFDTLSVNFQMENFDINWQSLGGLQTGPYDKPYGLAFIGNNGTIVADRGGWSLIPEMENNQPQIAAVSMESTRSSSEDHIKNFLECIKTREEPNCPVENGRLVAQYAHMGNIAQRTQSRLVWDQQKKTFGKNKPANQLITPEYRKPWDLPKL
ncbi:MAG: NADH-dependent dehydrogenase [Cyclobacteriaceae bacterium]|nr:MAG: NADH-dependent dehydrogenase [Cyclobacteriaceae bacterium]